ncbi:MAG TPA: flagellar basal body-associated FliL family protein [Mariniphaga sp.]|nr:flagellar basal body-associated FliL family protein [Mariniphaga sp.]
MSEKEEKNIKENDGKENQGKKDSNKILFIAIMAGMILVNAIAAFILIKVTRPKSNAEILEQIKADSIKTATAMATNMGATTAETPVEAIVNIAGTQGERFIKAAVIFEYNEKEFPNLGIELQRRAPKFKDLLINHLSKLTLMEVTEPDAKDKIRKDLLLLVNRSLPRESGKIREVLFTTYIIQ